MNAWLTCLRPGDALTVALAVSLVVTLFATLWSNTRADRAIIRQGGELVAEHSLITERRIEVEGPIGKTVIELAPGRARVVSDPGLRQYCVQQGWLTRVNAVAICAPNQVSLMLAGRGSGHHHDSLNY